MMPLCWHLSPIATIVGLYLFSGRTMTTTVVDASQHHTHTPDHSHRIIAVPNKMVTHSSKTVARANTSNNINTNNIQVPMMVTSPNSGTINTTTLFLPPVRHAFT
jgi:hypothetical protein